jgi:hypothetical protein
MNGPPAAPFLITRRQAVLAMLAGLAGSSASGWLRAETLVPTTQVPTALEPTSIQLFTPRGAGSKDGRDWLNATPLNALSKTLASAQPGSAFFIGFDPAEIEPVALDRGQVAIKVSGESDKPLFVQAGLMSGAKGIAAPGDDNAAFFKSSQPWSLETFGKQRGAACYFAINNGASHLRLSGFRIDGTSADGFIKFRAKRDSPATFEDIVISGIEARNVGRVIETDRGATLRNLLVADCRAVGIVRGFARFRSLSSSVLRNLDLDAANMDAGGKNVCQVISLESGDNVLFENVTVRNAVNQPPPRSGKEQGYVQGDGIVCERKTSNVVIRKCQASGMGDGGFDLKTTGVTIEDSSTDSCKYGARIWSEGSNAIRRCDFRNPQSRGNIKGACIQACGTLEITDTKLHAGPGTFAISLHKLDKGNDPVVRMTGGSIQTEGDGAVAGSTSSGVLELHNVMVNGVLTDHRYVFEPKKQ